MNVEEQKEHDADRYYERVQVLLFLLLEYVQPFRLSTLVGGAARMSWEQFQREIACTPGLGPYSTNLARELLGLNEGKPPCDDA